MYKKIMYKERTCYLELAGEGMTPPTHCFVYSICVKCSKNSKK